MEAKIPLRNRRQEVVAYALVDAEDARSVLALGRWHLTAKGYVAHAVSPSEKVLLHRFILGLGPGDVRQGDHVNRDRLDNRRSNLRIATQTTNAQNQPSYKNARSEFRGVSWIAPRRKWQAEVQINGVRHYLGLFADEVDAGRAAQSFRLAHMPGAVD